MENGLWMRGKTESLQNRYLKVEPIRPGDRVDRGGRSEEEREGSLNGLQVSDFNNSGCGATILQDGNQGGRSYFGHGGEMMNPILDILVLGLRRLWSHPNEDVKCFIQRSKVQKNQSRLEIINLKVMVSTTREAEA